MRKIVLLIFIISIFSYSKAQESSLKLKKTINSINLGVKIGTPTGIGINSKNNLVFFHRADREWKLPFSNKKIGKQTICIYDTKSEKIIKSFGSELFIMPHGLEVDFEDNIWVTDVALHQIFKFNTNGELLFKIGEESKPGKGNYSFNMPTDITVLKNGSFYVSDGYGNSRIVKYSKDAEFLYETGSYGDGQIGFDIPHGIDNDSENNIYVADRENNRIKKYSPNGNLLKIWQNKQSQQLYSIKYDKNNDLILAIDYYIKNNKIIGSDIIVLDQDLNFKYKYGRSRNYVGPITRYHDIDVDSNGVIYAADILNDQIQIFSKN
tara:strand:- start:948 stop:1913 length:966 start_codon:yes stop_codon:yes gene_type:complete